MLKPQKIEIFNNNKNFVFLIWEFNLFFFSLKTEHNTSLVSKYLTFSDC